MDHSPPPRAPGPLPISAHAESRPPRSHSPMGAGTRVVPPRSPPPLVLLLVLLAALPLAPDECSAALVAPPTTQRTEPPQETTAVGSRGGQGSDEEATRSSQPSVAQCRARCIQRCWENCELLQSDYAVWGALCTRRGICLPGCQHACKFHRGEKDGDWGVGVESPQDSRLVVHAKGNQVVRVVSVVVPHGGSFRRPSPALTVSVRCPTRPHSSRTNGDVYVVTTKEVDALFWTQATQTADLEARLGASTSARNRLGIRVLVVDPEGLVTIYSPSTNGNEGPPSSAGPSPPGPSSSSAPPGVVEEERVRGGSRGEGSSRGARSGRWPLDIREDVTSPLDGAQLALLFPTASTDSVRAAQMAESSPSQPVGSPWVLREVSVIRQRVLVVAEVSWEARGRLYLVTWEVDGGGLKGNLFTQTTSVTLSLWPQTLYHIQVEVVSRTPGDPQPPDRSEVLHLDTRRAVPSVLVPEPQKQAPTPIADQPSSLLPQPSSSVQELTARGESRAGGGRGAGEGWAKEQVLAGSGAALALFFAVLLFLVARRRRRGVGVWPCPLAAPRATILPPLILPPVEGKGAGEGESQEGGRGGLFFLLRSFAEALTGENKVRGGKADRPGAARAHPTAHILTVSGATPDGRRHRGQLQWLQHPESYADAFLREAVRGAGNEVQV